jgi:hypothetical protein
MTERSPSLLPAGVLLIAAFAVGGCVSTPPPPLTCSMPDERDLASAIEHTQRDMLRGCEASFDAYMDTLLAIAENDPGADNRIQFSGFLVWAADQGILGRRQSRELYNRYFNVKFVSLLGDYNNCASTCPNRSVLMDEMQRELADKERGLLKAVEDRDAYYRADRLMQQAELVIAATCQACEAGVSP